MVIFWLNPSYLIISELRLIDKKCRCQSVSCASLRTRCMAVPDRDGVSVVEVKGSDIRLARVGGLAKACIKKANQSLPILLKAMVAAAITPELIAGAGPARSATIDVTSLARYG
jgi:hypothetical protein